MRENNSFVVRLEGAKYCPSVVCGRCGEPITDYRAATVVWVQDNGFDEGTQHPVTVLCKKNGCTSGILIPGKGIRSQSLQEFLSQLMHNSGMKC